MIGQFCRHLAPVLLLSATSTLVATSAAALEIKTFTEGPVTVKATANKYFVEGGTFSTLGYVGELVAKGELPGDLTYVVSVVPRSPAIPKEDGTDENIPADQFTAYCMHSGSLERNDAVSWVPFVRTAAGAPIRINSTYDLRLTATREGQPLFEHSYEVRAQQEGRASRFKQPCADQGVAIGTLYRETFIAAFAKAMLDLKSTSGTKGPAPSKPEPADTTTALGK
jgi:hypothetical protein